MSRQKTALTQGQLTRLASKLLAHNREPADEHLSDDEFVYFSLGEVTDEEKMLIASHLDSCARCSAQMQGLTETSEAWRGPEAEERFKNKWEEIRAKVSSRMPARRSDLGYPSDSDGPQQATLLPDVALPGARLTKPIVAIDGQLAGGSIVWRIVEDDANNLIVRFRSHVMSVNGTELKLSAGNWRRVVTMAEVKPDQSGARTVITRQEREQMQAATPLRLFFFLGNS